MTITEVFPQRLEEEYALITLEMLNRLTKTDRYEKTEILFHQPQQKIIWDSDLHQVNKWAVTSVLSIPNGPFCVLTLHEPIWLLLCENALPKHIPTQWSDDIVKSDSKHRKVGTLTLLEIKFLHGKWHLNWALNDGNEFVQLKTWKTTASGENKRCRAWEKWAGKSVLPSKAWICSLPSYEVQTNIVSDSIWQIPWLNSADSLADLRSWRESKGRETCLCLSLLGTSFSSHSPLLSHHHLLTALLPIWPKNSVFLSLTSGETTKSAPNLLEFYQGLNDLGERKQPTPASSDLLCGRKTISPLTHSSHSVPTKDRGGTEKHLWTSQSKGRISLKTETQP